jgi:N-acetylglucosaminyl-diphospho-decaprenol L-rhamnosyltransferase
MADATQTGPPGHVAAGPVEGQSPSMSSSDVSVVVVTLNAREYVEACLDSVRDYRTIVVDHGSADGTLDVVRRRFPDATVLERENRGLAAGWNAGIREASGRYVLLLNADAWVRRGAVEQMARYADSHPDVGIVGPKLLNPDGSLQRSVRGFPTVWRLATEYFFLRKLAPRSGVLNAYYAGGFRHDAVREAEFLMGACLLIRLDAAAEVGPLDEDFFLFNEESDWAYRFRARGWKVVFLPDAEVVHVGGASHGGRMFDENVVSHLRFLAKHRGPAEAERARRLLLVALRLRGLLFRGERGRMYRRAALRLRSGTAEQLLHRR